jgi:DNA-damage-inducible protein D
MEDHFVDLNEMVSIGSGANRELISTKLTKYAYYLISLNVDRSKTSREQAESFLSTNLLTKQSIHPFR